MTVNPDGHSRVLYLLVCGAPAASDVHAFVELAQRSHWEVRVIATPMGARFVDTAKLEGFTDDRVRVDFRMPHEPDDLPPADAAVVVPATFNTINKWASGVADTFVVGLLCELAGLRVPILAVPLVKDALATHPAFGRNLEVLRSMGVRLLFDPDASEPLGTPSWDRVLDELHVLAGAPSG
ncbi:MAG: flavoprotein [Streptosporangiaceae bacterium]